MVHCILAGSHFSQRKDIFDAVRGVYNPNRPPGCRVAPPFEEWTEMRQLCDHVLCRYITTIDHTSYLRARCSKGVTSSVLWSRGWGPWRPRHSRGVLARVLVLFFGDGRNVACFFCAAPRFCQFFSGASRSSLSLWSKTRKPPPTTC